MNPTLMKLRFTLSVLALVAIVALAAGVLFYGKDLSQIQVALLTLLASALIAEAKSSSSWAFDGVPDKSPNPQPAGPAQP